MNLNCRILFSEINALSISGKPVFLGYTRTAKNVGPMGSITIMTDEVAYEVDAATFELHSELKDLFGGGVPSGFSPVARVDAWEADRGTGLCTFLANKDGKLYRRQLSKIIWEGCLSILLTNWMKKGIKLRNSVPVCMDLPRFLVGMKRIIG